MARKIKLITDCYYHIYNRGIDKRKIYLDNQDYFRFIQYLYQFNDSQTVANFGWRFKKGISSRGLASMAKDNLGKVLKETREKLVDVICFCLMPNHFHLILKQLRDEGISKFLLKLSTGYVMYFNQKNQRTGRLFEGPFKNILVEKDEYLIHLSRYIHLNPVELIEPNWKEDGIKNWEKVNRFLEQYKWSSYLDYISKSDFSSIVETEFLLEYFNSKENYKRFINEWVTEDIERYQGLLLE